MALLILVRVSFRKSSLGGKHEDSVGRSSIIYHRSDKTFKERQIPLPCEIAGMTSLENILSRPMYQFDWTSKSEPQTVTLIMLVEKIHFLDRYECADSERLLPLSTS